MGVGGGPVVDNNPDERRTRCGFFDERAKCRLDSKEWWEEYDDRFLRDTIGHFLSGTVLYSVSLGQEQYFNANCTK